MPSPQVTKIPPSSFVSRDHHGPQQNASANIPGRIKPRYFKNPWPSYRTASLKDAYQAYQRGAAIALHPSRLRGVAKLEGKQDSDADDSEYELEPAWTESDSIMPKKIYVRPEFARVGSGDEREDWRDPPVEVVEPTWGDGSDGREKVTWLGHAGVLIQIPWKTSENPDNKRNGTCGILFDPIFSYRCSPTQYAGPARYIDSPCTVSMLPEIHACCISHDHYDHLDYYTIMDLWKYHQSTIHFFVPMGLKQWFTSSGIPAFRVTELDWWHETVLTFSETPDFDYDPHYPPEEPEDALNKTPNLHTPSALALKIVFTPAQHRSGRGVLDHMTTLWGSWCVGVVEDADREYALEPGMKDWKGFKAYFGGDTGYRYATAPEEDDSAICPAFQRIGDLYGPFTFAMLPLSTGSSLPFLRTVLSLSLDQYLLTSSLHCSPADSLEIHRVIQSQRTLGIHWGTFCDADEARGTRVEFGRSRRAVGVSRDWEAEEARNGRFVIADIGETLTMPAR
ncbi:hypothetical protein B9479_003578 [Cryptococcus floricola]|uniref:Metallo-beta-lactamase domain-containing protein n=1 Tax=Cryptococcus floricola TaxID=2591691 RepID=A0A5D3AW83_9TREE|nr:hypothetical protein B9479_003578 [Cryptococcus floricola]